MRAGRENRSAKRVTSRLDGGTRDVTRTNTHLVNLDVMFNLLVAQNRRSTTPANARERLTAVSVYTIHPSSRALVFAAVQARASSPRSVVSALPRR
jgi:hypothetical protein